MTRRPRYGVRSDLIARRVFASIGRDLAEAGGKARQRDIAARGIILEGVLNGQARVLLILMAREPTGIQQGRA